MGTRDVVVIGGSAESLDALAEVVRALPADLGAAVLVAVHVPRTTTRNLPALLARAGTLPAAHGVHGEPLEAGRIYVAPPDHHLLVRGGRVALSRGPEENGVRPAADALFRSAAMAYGGRVLAVALAGAHGDGLVGLAHVRERGGLGVVQHPGEAPFAGMGATAADDVLPTAEIAALIVSECAGGGTRRELASSEEDAPRTEPGIGPEPVTGGPPVGVQCPLCTGALAEAAGEPARVFRCPLGHRWSGSALLEWQAQSVDSRLAAAAAAVQEQATLTGRLAEEARRAGDSALGSRLQARAAHAAERLSALAALMESGPPSEASRGGERDEATSAGTVDDVASRPQAALLLAAAEVLIGNVDLLVAAFGDRMRAEPRLPGARELDRTHLEDHYVTLITELGQCVHVIATEGPDSRLLDDGTEIQHVIAHRHGRQRRAIGWTEEQVVVEGDLLREELERAIRTGAGDEAAAEAMKTLRSLTATAERAALQSFRTAPPPGA
ncbi:MAG TPA: chemotaxis protein CheB [Longimicrobiaceae bacterium]|jgi:two-component system chemotaxis response regulator CheB|nr:chemotaxis protein CheB [Longimicrobiaceae bacterium]